MVLYGHGVTETKLLGSIGDFVKFKFVTSKFNLYSYHMLAHRQKVQSS